MRFNSLLGGHATGVLVLQEIILQQNFLERCSEFTEQKNRLPKFIVVVSVLAFFLSIGITMYAVSQPDSIPGLVTMNDFGKTQTVKIAIATSLSGGTKKLHHHIRRDLLMFTNIKDANKEAKKLKSIKKWRLLICEKLENFY